MNITFKKPIIGEYFDITKAGDAVFGEKLLGPGFLVKPQDKHIYAPIDGSIKMIYPTLHAIAISNGTVDILIHVGLTEVIRDEKLFQLHVKLNDRVMQGDRLLTLNFEFANYLEQDYDTPIVFVQKQSLTIFKETKDCFKLGIL